MSEQIEIEFKNLLTEKEFKQLLDLFQVKPKQFITQKNHYFDTKDFKLKEQQSALRIREKNDRYELTLKQPLGEEKGLLETTSILERDAAQQILKKGCQFLPEHNNVAEKLVDAGLNLNEIIHFGTLTTERAEFNYQNGLLVLDKSSYFHIQDYEVEFEVDDYQVGQIVFNQLLSDANIPSRQTENKVQRFYKQMNRTT